MNARLGDFMLRLIRSVGELPQKDFLHFISAENEESSADAYPSLLYDFSEIAECMQYTVVQGCKGSSFCSGITSIEFQ